MINKVILVGNVGVDPEVRAMESGVKVARVRLATSERMYNRQTNETTEHTEWHTVTLWRGLAETVDRFVRKGSQLYIEGRLRTREWTDKEGNKRRSAEIVADSVYFGDSKRDGEGGGSFSSGYRQDGGYSQPAPRSGSYGGGDALSGYGAPPADGDQFAELSTDDGNLPF